MRSPWRTTIARLPRPRRQATNSVSRWTGNDMDQILHDRLTGWRRHLHANPELTLHERETAAFVQACLTELGVPFTASIGGHGVVATISRGQSIRSVGLRADMDALPIQETSGVPHA